MQKMMIFCWWLVVDNGSGDEVMAAFLDDQDGNSSHYDAINI